VQKRFYPQLRVKFGLAAQPAIRVIGKTVDAYTTLRADLEAGNYGPPGSELRRTVEATPMVFRPVAAQPFDARCLSWQFGDLGRDGTVSIWTVAGRLRTLRLVGNPRHLLLLLRGRTIGETDLITVTDDGCCTRPSTHPRHRRGSRTGSSGSDLGTGEHRHHQRWRPVQRVAPDPVPDTAAAHPGTTASQADVLRTPVAEETPPEGGPVRRRGQPSDQQEHRGRG
jgi:hypothetical protein